MWGTQGDSGTHGLSGVPASVRPLVCMNVSLPRPGKVTWNASGAQSGRPGDELVAVVPSKLSTSWNAPPT